MVGRLLLVVFTITILYLGHLLHLWHLKGFDPAEKKEESKVSEPEYVFKEDQYELHNRESTVYTNTLEGQKLNYVTAVPGDGRSSLRQRELQPAEPSPLKAQKGSIVEPANHQPDRDYSGSKFLKTLISPSLA